MMILKSYSIIPLFLILFALQSCAQIMGATKTEVWVPEPKVIKGVSSDTPPSDAIILFDGTNTDTWQRKNGKPIKWEVADSIMTVTNGDIYTKESFGDCQLHIEWSAPTPVKGEGQDRGNSGVYIQDRYEVQILDSYNNRTYSNGQATAIYKQHIPLVNVTNPPGEWNTYDIIFKAPVFNDKKEKVSPGYITVIHNGVLVQNHVEIKGSTKWIGPPTTEAHGEAPIRLQDHDSPVKFRNIWIRRL